MKSALLLTFLFASPAFAFDSSSLDAHFCADQSEDTSTEAGGICITCLMSGFIPSSIISTSKDEKQLVTPTKPDEVQRDLAFMNFLSRHSNWMGLDTQVLTRDGLAFEIEKLKKHQAENAPKIAHSAQAVNEIQSALNSADGDKPNEEKYQDLLKAQGKNQQWHISETEAELSAIRSEGAPEWRIHGKITEIDWWKTNRQKTLKLAAQPHDKDAFAALKREMAQYLKSQQSALGAALHQKSMDDALISNYEHQLSNLPKFTSPQEEVKFYETEYQKSLVAILNRHRVKTCGMSAAELMAIHIYTGNGYREINGGLRAGGERAKEVQPFVDELNSALKKLRNYSGQVIRFASLPPAALNEHQPGKIVKYAAFTSSSVTGDWHGNIKIIIQSKTGHYLDPLSDNPGEEEVLFASDSRFKVLNREGDALHGRIVLEEVSP